MMSSSPLKPVREVLDRDADTIHYFEHGYPCELVRWHYHSAYELHYIVTGTGKALVGDYIGPFEAGCLMLVGPGLPHNWISDCPLGTYLPLRDRVIQFEHQTIENLRQHVPEITEVMPMLEQASYGIRFSNRDGMGETFMKRIRDSAGAGRFGHFCQFLHALAQDDYRLLSSRGIAPVRNGHRAESLDEVVKYAAENYNRRIYLSEVAGLIGMSETYFSRFFHRTTGRRFVDFLNGIRISKACESLCQSDDQISQICFSVGFNSVANFNRRFFECKGMSPSEYRELSRTGVQASSVKYG